MKKSDFEEIEKIVNIMTEFLDKNNEILFDDSVHKFDLSGRAPLKNRTEFVRDAPNERDYRFIVVVESSRPSVRALSCFVCGVVFLFSQVVSQSRLVGEKNV